MDQYVVVGNPIEHSRSPVIHEQFANQTDQKINYQKQLVELGQFERFIGEFKAAGGKGCNITVPFKEQAFELADQLSDRAQAAGAVNTLIFKDDGTIVGDNTDGCNSMACIGGKIGECHHESGVWSNRKVTCRT